MNKFVIFTDPISAELPGGGPSIGSSLTSKGFAAPNADRPVVWIADERDRPTLCVAYEPEPHERFTAAGMGEIEVGIRQFIERTDNCFVLFHAGSEMDRGRHQAQASIFDGLFLFESDYRHSRAAPHTLFCEALADTKRIPALLHFLVNPAKLAERIKLKASRGHLIPDGNDPNWRALVALSGLPLVEMFQANVATDHGEFCDRLTNVVTEINNSFHASARR